jgi:dinuclear metal center YbgI/SA1388 family protein
MKVADIQKIIEEWAPKQLAWDRDNIGLLAGSSSQPVKKILVALDVTEEVIEEAIDKKADLLVTHHPVIFGSVKSITDHDRTGRLLLRLIRKNIALFAAHTNLDFTREGVSFALAKKLNLQNARVLHKDIRQYNKVAVFIPVSHTEKVMLAMANAGAGSIGAYDSCSFQSEGTGTFRPLKGSNPFIGSTGTLERVDEMRLEMIVPTWKLNPVLEAMKAAHPYEEIAYDVYALANVSSEYGSGVIGELPKPASLRVLLQTVRKKLNVPSLRFTGMLNQTVSSVAVCGGSGADLLPVAIQQGADVFLTADVKYHTFQQAEDAIALIDAGHYETEIPIVQQVVSYLSQKCRERKEGVAVLASEHSYNPVQYYL